MDSNRASHEQMLWPLNYLAMTLEKVAAFESLESKEIVVEISRVVNFRVDEVFVLHDHIVDFFTEEGCIPATDIFVVEECFSNFAEVI